MTAETSLEKVSAARPLSTGAHVVLGLLLDRPASGWDIAQAAERSISHFWPLTRAHIYTELPKLAARDFATVVEVRQERSPDKRVYTATDAGRDAFATWLDTVELVEEHGRQPLQLQMFFSAHASPQRLEALLSTWERKAVAAENLCREILKLKGVNTYALGRLTLGGPERTTRPVPAQNPISGLDARATTALFGLRRAQADQQWLAEVRQFDFD